MRRQTSDKDAYALFMCEMNGDGLEGIQQNCMKTVTRTLDRVGVQLDEIGQTHSSKNGLFIEGTQIVQWSCEQPRSSKEFTGNLHRKINN